MVEKSPETKTLYLEGLMTDSTKIYTTGCFSGFKMYIADNAGVAVGVVVGVIVLLILGTNFFFAR